MFRNLLCISKKKEDVPKKPQKNYIEYVVQKDFENNECIICLDSMKCEELVIVLGCGHTYHKTCLVEWFKKKKLCPLCDI